ncbi:unnamed protein product [Absidia cylindrospora]
MPRSRIYACHFCDALHRTASSHIDHEELCKRVTGHASPVVDHESNDIGVEHFDATPAENDDDDSSVSDSDASDNDKVK